MRVSDFNPEDVGVNVVVTVHVAAAAMVAPLVHVPPVIANCVPVVSAGASERVTVDPPLLVAVNVTVDEVLPTVVSVKVAAAIVMEPPAKPFAEIARVTVCPAAAPLL